MNDFGTLVVRFYTDEGGQRWALVLFLPEGGGSGYPIGEWFTLDDGQDVVISPACVQCEMSTEAWAEDESADSSQAKARAGTAHPAKGEAEPQQKTQAGAHAQPVRHPPSTAPNPPRRGGPRPNQPPAKTTPAKPSAHGPHAPEQGKE